jgi:hypothetical protein
MVSNRVRLEVPVAQYIAPVSLYLSDPPGPNRVDCDLVNLVAYKKFGDEEPDDPAPPYWKTPDLYKRLKFQETWTRPVVGIMSDRLGCRCTVGLSGWHKSAGRMILIWDTPIGTASEHTSWARQVPLSRRRHNRPHGVVIENCWPNEHLESYLMGGNGREDLPIWLEITPLKSGRPLNAWFEQWLLELAEVQSGDHVVLMECALAATGTGAGHPPLSSHPGGRNANSEGYRR